MVDQNECVVYSLLRWPHS